MLLGDFTRSRVPTAGAEIAVAHAGSGPPVLLLHGYPQTHVMWHRVASRLAERFTVVCPDLRGYGASSKPPGGDDHAGYSKRALARDQVEVMASLGFERFAVVGHDRGGRVAHRLALDHAQRVERVALLDILPTRTLFGSLDQQLATGMYHWFFLIQPDGLPERLIGNDPEYFLRWHLRAWSAGRDDFFDPEAMAAYVEAFRDPATIHATCEDYRAGASIDLVHDESDLDRRVECPLLVLWGEKGKPLDLLPVWREKAVDVRGEPLPCGHFLAEELPDETSSALGRFLAA